VAINKPKPIPHLSTEEIARFWSKVDKRGPDECWPWIGNCFKSGYGRYSRKGDSQNAFKASRIAYFLCTGDDPGDLIVRHSCDNPPCCNGHKHLLKGTNADNSRDMAGRGRAASGDKNGLRLHPPNMAVDKTTIMNIVRFKTHQYASQENTITSDATLVPERVAVVVELDV
jgi:hypothetical protein